MSERDEQAVALSAEQIERVAKYGLMSLPYDERPQTLIALCDMALRAAAATDDNLRNHKAKCDWMDRALAAEAALALKDAKLTRIMNSINVSSPDMDMQIARDLIAHRVPYNKRLDYLIGRAGMTIAKLIKEKVLWAEQATDNADRFQKAEAALAARPAEDGLAERLKRLRKFLDGSAGINGLWFGELHDSIKGAFWWRKELLPIIDEAAAALGRQA